MKSISLNHLKSLLPDFSSVRLSASVGGESSNALIDGISLYYEIELCSHNIRLSESSFELLKDSLRKIFGNSVIEFHTHTEGRHLSLYLRPNEIYFIA